MTDSIANDVLTGARAIGEYIGKNPRQVYYLAQLGALPVFFRGKLMHARKSQLDADLRAKAPEAA